MKIWIKGSVFTQEEVDTIIDSAIKLDIERSDYKTIETNISSFKWIVIGSIVFGIILGRLL